MVNKKILFLITIIFLTTINLVHSAPCRKVYGYLAGWAAPAGWSLNDIDWQALTHILDCFAIPKSNGTLDIDSGGTGGGTLRKSSLIDRAHLEGVRCMYSVGGQNGSSNFSTAVNSTYRTTFVNNLINVMTTYGYDGIDIDWEFPGSGDKSNFTAFMQQLYNAIKSSGNGFDGKPRELTFYTTAAYYDNGVDWGVIHQYCDYAIQSGYAWDDPYAAPLRRPGQTTVTLSGAQIEASIDGFANLLVTRGFPRSKIILGLPFYCPPGNLRYGDVVAGGTYLGYDANPAEARYNYSGQTRYVNNQQAYQDKWAYVRNNNQPGIAIWEISMIYPRTELWSTIKTESCVGCTATPTPTAPTPTPTYTASGTMLDDFEDGEYMYNNREGYWTQWASENGTITRTMITSGAPQGTYALQVAGNVVGTNWPSISVATNLNVANTAEDLRNTTGLKICMKGKKGTGGNVTFFIQLISTNITDYSYWRYTWTPTTNWTCLSIPWTSFMPPAYGQGASLSLQQVLSCVRAFQWAIVAESQSCTNNGNEWCFDAIEVYGGIIPSTNTPTKTNTPTFTRTFTPSSTGTNTATFTVTQTATRTNTGTNTVTNTATNTVTNTATNTNLPTNTLTNTSTVTSTNTRTNTATNTFSPTVTSTLTNTSTGTYTITRTNTGTQTPTNTQTNTRTNTNTFTITNTPTETVTGTQPPTWTFTNTSTPTRTFTSTNTNTFVPTITSTFTATTTRTLTLTGTFTYTITVTPSRTVTSTFTYTFTNTPTYTNTTTGTQPPTWTFTDTPIDTSTRTATDTMTFTETYTSTQVPTATRTATATQEATGTIIDDFEEGDFDITDWGGLWTQWGAGGCYVTRVVTTDAGLGIYAGKISADIAGSGWPSVAVTFDLNTSGTEMDLSATQGIRLYIKGNKGSGTAVDFLIQLVSTNITDYSYWRYNYTPSENWALMEIPWSGFTPPSWGQGAALTINDVLQHIRAINFAIADTTGGVANNTGNNWYIDNIELMVGGAPTGTATWTPTMTATQTSTGTQSPTWTFTNTGTATLTNTSIIQLTDTPTIIPTEVDKLEIIQETPVIIYPNPVNNKTDIKVKFAITKSANKFIIRIYTSAMRLIKEKITIKNLKAGLNEEIIEAKYINNLARGIYYYMIMIEDDKGRMAKSRVEKIVIF